MEENMDGEGGNLMRNMSVQGMFGVKCELCLFLAGTLPAGHRLQRSSWRWVGLLALKISGAKKQPPMSKEG